MIKLSIPLALISCYSKGENTGKGVIGLEFYTPFHEKRPVRLSEAARRFARESLHGKYGDDTVRLPSLDAGEITGFDEMNQQEKYDACILKIAAEAPIRICGEETVSGAATLGAAIRHMVPVTYKGEYLWPSISHLTVDFFTVVYEGVDALEKRIRNRLERPCTELERFRLNGMLTVIRAMHIWHERYLLALQERKPENYRILKNVPFRPAENFKEAVQSLWFTFAFIRLCGNWPGIGRIDEILGPFLKNDLKKGSLTLEEAREFLAGMLIKGCEWIQSNTPPGAGDAQHYQNIILGGIDAGGSEVTNEVTYLVLDIIEELSIGDFPISVRVGETTPEALLTRVTEVMRHGGGIVAVYNEALVLEALAESGYPPEEARRFANDGCWEVQIPGKTLFGYHPFDSLQILLHDTLKLNTGNPASFSSYHQLYEAFRENLKAEISKIAALAHKKFLLKPDISNTPCSVVSLFENQCIEKGLSYLEGGCEYALYSPHIGGAPDVGNCLYAIDKLVFQEQKLTFDEFMGVLKQNWEGNEALRQYCLNKYTYYGNDCDESDAYTVRVLDDFSALVAAADTDKAVRMPAGVSTFGRQIEWAPVRGAAPFGKKMGDILSGNASPSPGTDMNGATAIIRSYCKINLSKMASGAALDVRLYPSTVWGSNGLEALKALIRGFVQLGGFFMQLDVVDSRVLKEAQQKPEDYKTLSVRVSGWNARFVTLNREWQRMIIERSEQGIQ